MKLMVLLTALTVASIGWAVPDLETGFVAPSREYQPWCYWWWLNGAASKEGITRDMKELAWDEQGAQAVLVSDKDQTVTIVTPDRAKRPCALSAGQTVEVNL